MTGRPPIFRPIVVVGIPRSGTTWVARILSSPAGRHYRHEPDNEKLHPVAFYLKQALHRFPYLRSADDSPEFETLWRLALGARAPWRVARKLVYRIGRLTPEVVEHNIQSRCGGERGEKLDPDQAALTRWQRGRSMAAYSLMKVLYAGYTAGKYDDDAPRLVKSVHSVLALPWLVARFDVRLLIVRRHPLSIAASQLRMGMPDADRSIFSQRTFMEDFFGVEQAEVMVGAVHPLQRLGYQLAAMERFLNHFVREHPDCLVVEHEAICRDPEAEFTAISDRLGLPWEPAVVQAIDSSNHEGDGYDTRRVRREQVDKWKRRLDVEQVGVLERCFSALDVPLN